ncbi:hypothetical protein G6011_11167 [Alternaria panax]|uniref:Uncharacterized protein n=1 Tax=Alternaria panax TaxID=48097 RepID=A0AAD4IDB7_9PLEO|nr:hypothetical protein G6011_11167 [Alternaria panax]
MGTTNLCILAYSCRLWVSNAFNNPEGLVVNDAAHNLQLSPESVFVVLMDSGFSVALWSMI